MRANKNIRHYTLVELLVAMGVFTIIMLALTQFFASAQKVWTGTTKKVGMYEDSRVTMNLIANDLQSIYYCDGYGPFWNDTGNKRLCFVSILREAPSGCSSKIVEAQYIYDDTNNKLLISYTGDSSGTTLYDFNSTAVLNAYTSGNGDKASTDNAIDEVFGTTLPTISAASSDAAKAYTLIPYVTGFAVSTFNKDGSIYSSDEKAFPYGVNISLKLLDKTNYTKWKATGLSSVKDNNERTFTRQIIIGNRGQY